MYLPCCFVVYGCSDVIKGGIFTYGEKVEAYITFV